MHKNDSGFASVLVVLALAGILVLGSVGVAGAANNAVPGSALYSVDMGLEAIQLGLTSNPQAQVDLRTQFMAERLAEAQQILQEQGAGAPGIDIALANLTEHRVQINTLISQNQELRARVRALESQLEQNQQGLESAFQTAGQKLEAQLEIAKKSGNTTEASRLEAQLDALEAQEESLDDEDEIEEEEPEETPEPEEEKEAEEAKESSEDENSRSDED